MLSTAYCAEIRPEPILRRTVFWSGVLLGAAGVAIILALPVRWSIRFAAATAWVILGVRELLCLRAAWLDCRALRFTADNEIWILGADSEWRPGSWASGGILLQNLGWLRLRNNHGSVFVELVRGDCRSGQDWRRLQVIWRHVGEQG